MEEKIINKAYKTEITFNSKYIPIINQFIGNNRFIYNTALSIMKRLSQNNITHYYENIVKDGKIETKKVSIFHKKNFQFIGTYLNNEYSFLKKSHSQSNQNSIHILHNSWSNYLDPKNKGKEPKFKKKRDKNSFYLPCQNGNITLIGNHIHIKPLSTQLKKIDKDFKSLMNFQLSNKIPKDLKSENITGITISKSKNRYFISINYKYSISIHKLTINNLIEYLNNKSNKIIGLDLGLKDKLITSKSNKFNGINNSPKYKKLIQEKKSNQRKLSKKIENKKRELISQRVKNGYDKINKKEYKKLLKTRKDNKYSSLIKVDKLLFKVLKSDYKFEKGTWKDFYKQQEIKKLQRSIFFLEKKLLNIKDNENHHISKKIVEDNDFIFMEDLSLKGMKALWGNKIKELSLYNLQKMIQYKAENQGKSFFKIDRFYPSTKTCSCCGIINDIKLKDRIYSCECGNVIDRDINAAINIKYEGIQSLFREKNVPLPSFVRDSKDLEIKISRVVDDNIRKVS